MVLKKIQRKKSSFCACGSYIYQCKIVHRDNKDWLNKGDGSGGGYRTRIPSIKRSDATWKRFYNLFPEIFEHLKQGNYYQGQVENGNIITVKETRIHCGYTRKRTIKFKKIW